MSMMIMKGSITRAIRGAIPDSDNAMSYIKSVEEQFLGTSKSLASTLMIKMITMKYDGHSGVLDIPPNSWWIDTGASIHITNSLQGYLTSKRLSKGERTITLGNGIEVEIEAIDTFHLILDTGFIMDLVDTVYVLVFTRNLISVPKLYSYGYELKFGNKIVSLYSYVYLIHEKSEALDVFEIYKAKVENQLNWRIKSVRSYRGGEYYGRFTESGQHLSVFALFLREHGIIAKYTLPGTPEQNGVAERRNHTLIDMVRIMMTLKTTIHILNCVSSKAIPKTPYELWGPKTVETRHAMFLENEYFSGRTELEKLTSNEVSTLMMEYGNVPTTEVSLRRSQREKRPTISNDYEVYLNECDYDVGLESDPTSYDQAINSEKPTLWLYCMEQDLKSMKDNEARLVAKGYTQKEGIDYKETFSPVSKKDSLRIVMALVAHFDLELHQMDVKTAFLNSDLHEDVYMDQLEGFQDKGKAHMVCKLKKSIYGLKQASRQWYLKFHEILITFGFKENLVDQCIYLKITGSKICVIVLYVDDMLLASNNMGMILETKQFLSKNFDMKDLGEASYNYIEKVLKKFNMQNCYSSVAPVVKGDIFCELQCPKNDIEKKQMDKIPYAFAVGSIMYAQVCTRLDIAYVVGMLGRYQSNPSIDHWKAVKKVLCYLQGTKDYMLTYRKINNLEIIGYSNSDYAICKDTRKSTSRRGFVLQPLLLALDSAFVKVMEPALEWLFKLYSLGLIRGVIDGKEMIEAVWKSANGEDVVDLAVLKVIFYAIRFPMVEVPNGSKCDEKIGMD
ncbi:hypothetical protein AAG906_008078 [Vitis piasezkii]